MQTHSTKHTMKDTQINPYRYPYFHRNFAEYSRLRSEIACKRTVLARDIGHSNTVPFTRLYTYNNLIMIERVDV
jgi:hypothetical protein